MERKTRQQLLKEVKERMASGNYNEIHKLKSVKNVDRVVLIGEHRLSESEIFSYYEKVTLIQNSDELKCKAIGLLIDDEIYKKLSDSAKQRYVLEIGKFYHSLLEEYQNKSVTGV